MIELPNYSSQLMQQLWSLRKEGHYCDCTIMVGESQHPAHKLVLAASSMLFRSLLDGSDTISIDTAVVSPQEFGCLLDMVYTGKLPLGKHNVSRIVAAADSLQMFDVAVGFKNVLASLVTQQPPAAVRSAQTPNPDTIDKAQSGTPDAPKDGSASDMAEMKTELKKESREDGHNPEEPACKKVCVEPLRSSVPEGVQSSEMVASEEDHAASEESGSAAAGLLKHSSQLVELLTDMPSVVALLSRVAATSLADAESEVVRQCCGEPDSTSALERLRSSVEEGLISEGALLKLLRALQREAPASFPSALLPLLEEAERAAQLAQGTQTAVSTEQQDSGTSEEKQAEHADCKHEAGEDEREANAETDLSSPPSSPSKPYTCRWCKKTFDYKCRLAAHTKRCTLSQEGEQQCPDCPKKLCNQRALQRHRAEAHNAAARAKKKVSCDLCGRSFAHPSGMIYHKRTEHFDEKPFACQECGAKFGANSSLKNHMRLHTGEKPFQCKHCDVSFSVAAALAYHTKKKHSEGKMYVCQYCKAVFAQSIELTRHVRTHTGDRPYVCRECGKGYSQASGLTVHLQTFHNLSEPQDCQKCCLSFSTLEEHRQHIEEFHPKEFHKCPTCNKVFTSAALLDKHKATHNGTKPFSCDLCNKSYQQLSGLWYHNRTNHPDVFASHTRQLKTLVQCDVCFKFFPSAASLAKHRAAEHQGSEVAAAGCCPYCPAVLGSSEEVQEHISSQHVSQCDEAFSCPLCSLLCASQTELQEHLLACHIETPQEQEGEADPKQEEQAATSYTVISGQGDDTQAIILPDEPKQLGAPQHLLVALSGGAEGRAAAELVEVNMFDLLNSSVTFICEDKSAALGALP